MCIYKYRPHPNLSVECIFCLYVQSLGPRRKRKIKRFKSGIFEKVVCVFSSGQRLKKNTKIKLSKILLSNEVRCFLVAGVSYLLNSSPYDHPVNTTPLLRPARYYITTISLCPERFESPVISLFYNLVNPTTMLLRPHRPKVVVLIRFHCTLEQNINAFIQNFEVDSFCVVSCQGWYVTLTSHNLS